jgi:hypothetical protein
MARSHAIAVAIKQHAGEQARLRNLSVSTALGVVAGEPRLNHIPQLPIDYRRLFAGIGPFLVKRAVIWGVGAGLYPSLPVGFY